MTFSDCIAVFMFGDEDTFCVAQEWLESLAND